MGEWADYDEWDGKDSDYYHEIDWWLVVIAFAAAVLVCVVAWIVG